MFHKITKIIFLPNYQIIATFEDKSIFYDFKLLFERIPAFKGLVHCFQSGKIIAKGYGISWNDDLDISSEEIYNNGTEVHGI